MESSHEIPVSSRISFTRIFIIILLGILWNTFAGVVIFLLLIQDTSFCAERGQAMVCIGYFSIVVVLGVSILGVFYIWVYVIRQCQCSVEQQPMFSLTPTPQPTPTTTLTPTLTSTPTPVPRPPAGAPPQTLSEFKQDLTRVLIIPRDPTPQSDEGVFPNAPRPTTTHVFTRGDPPPPPPRRTSTTTFTKNQATFIVPTQPEEDPAENI